MLKKIFIIIISCAMLIFCTACANKVNDKESVSVEKLDGYGDYTFNHETLSQEIAFEKNAVSVVFKEILYEEVITKLFFQINNQTENNLKIISTDLAVNNFMCTDSLITDIPLKSRQDAYIEISNEWFFKHDIQAIKNIEYVIRVLDENSNEMFKSDVITAKTNAPNTAYTQMQHTGFSVYNNDGIVFLARELKKSKFSNDFELDFYIENNTEKTFSVMSENVKINGKDITPTFLITVGANKKAIDSMLFEEVDLKAIKENEIKTFEASFKAFNDKMENVFETDIIQIPVK